MNTEQNYMMQRSGIEHHLLPDALFDNPKQLIGAMAANGEEILFSIYDKAMPGKIRREQFAVKAVPNTLGGISLILKLPPPDTVLACPFIGMLCGKDGTNPEYYTIERTMEGGFLLCTKPNRDSHAIMAERCGMTPKEHIQAIMKQLKIGLPKA